MRKTISLISFSCCLVASCGTTQLTSLWKDPSYNSPPLNKILVIAFRKNPVNRRMWEDAIVSAVSKQETGASAVPSYQLFPNDVPQPESLSEEVKDRGFDGVLVVSRVKHDILTNQVPGYMTSEPVTRYNRRQETYVTRYEDVYHAGYTDTATAVSVQTDLFLARGDEGQLVWSATSQSIDPVSRDEFRTAVASAVVKQLTKAQLIP